MEEPDNQLNNSSKPWLWKKGQSGNLKGRPKGQTMKEYIKEYLSKMTDEERDEWLEGINKIELFKMAEGNPQTNTDITSNGKTIILPATLIDKNDITRLSGNSGEGQTQI